MPTITLVDVLTTAMAAEHVDMHPTSITRAIRDGELPAERVGHQLFVKPADLERWAATRVDHRRRQP